MIICLKLEVIESKNEQFKEKTIIAVTHRLSIKLEIFDKIFVFHKDGITESESIEELINKKGDFYNILQETKKKFKNIFNKRKVRNNEKL